MVFHTILGTPEGRPTLHVAFSDRLLFDKRIPPTRYMEDAFSFAVSRDAAMALLAKVKLRYRSAFQKVARLLFEDGPPIFSIVDMAVAKAQVR